MRHYTLDGMSPAAAAELAMAAVISDDGLSVTQDRVAVLPTGPRPGTTTEPAPLPPTADESALRRGLLRAAMAMEAERMLDLACSTLEHKGVVWSWDHVFAPVLVHIGQRWEHTGSGVEIEHLLARQVATALRQSAARMDPPLTRRAALLGCAPDELHDLPLDALQAALAERHVRARSLGPRVPVAAMRDAIKRGLPPAVLLWAHQEHTADLDALELVDACCPSMIVVAAGPGWGPELPQGVHRARDLPEAVALLARVSGR
jgi:hypothetical protein